MEEIKTDGQNVKLQENEEENILKLALSYFDLYVRAYYWLYPIAVALALVVGGILCLTLTPRYRATCRMQISNQEMRPLKVQNVMDQQRGGASFLNTQMTILREGFIVRDALKRLGNLGEEAGLFSWPSVHAVGDTDLVDISIESPEPKAAAAMANAVADAYIAFRKGRKGDISSSGEDLLRNQLRDSEQNRDLMMNKLLKFKEDHGIYDFDQYRTTLTEQIASLESRMFDCDMAVSEYQMALDALREHKEEAVTFLPYFLPSKSEGGGRLMSLRMMELEHEMTLPKLTADFGMMHPSMQAFKEVSRKLREAKQMEVDISLKGMELHIQHTKKQRLMLEGQRTELQKKLAELDHLSGSYKLLEDAHASLSRNCTLLINRIDEIKIAAATTKVDNFSIAIIERASAPGAPFYPRPMRILLFSFLAGIALAVAVAFVLVTLDVKVTDADTARQALGIALPIYGTIPLFNEAETELLKSNGRKEIDEVFQSLRTSLNLSMKTRDAKFLVVSSSVSGEGKTFVSCNLARSFSRDGRRTLLLELDMRLPRLGKLLKDFITPDMLKRGVSNVLVGDCSLEEVTHHLEPLNIDVVFAGPRSPNPNELIGSTGLKKLLAEASAKYDLTVIDTAPLYPVTDTLLLAAMGYPLLLVTRYDSVTRPILRQLGDKLNQLNLRPTGLIVNALNVHEHGYGKYGYGKYGYGRYGRYGYGYGAYGYGGYGHNSADENDEKKEEDAVSDSPREKKAGDSPVESSTGSGKKGGRPAKG